jgi:hypothetical protein
LQLSSMPSHSLRQAEFGVFRAAKALFFVARLYQAVVCFAVYQWLWPSSDGKANTVTK